MSETERPQSVIGFRTALILYAVLAIAALASLKGTFLALALIIILGLAAKSVIHHYRERLE
ncbi:MAG: hypothetical protein JO217_00415 [Acidobacteriaceae bacterium]|nr:hypothetical protein [Acidobacteriaceae bacterium]MBV9441130.1 hypothetical protein [Acidobacteriaceae bacterium]